MDVQNIWLIAMSIAAPTAGIVGFAIQLRQVKKTRLENEKLQLEIATLKREAAAAKNRIVSPTTEEVIQFTSSKDIRFENRLPASPPRENTNALIRMAAAFLLILIIGNTLWNFYNFVVWIINKF